MEIASIYSHAPILLFVYNRPEHTQRAIASLQANALAKKSVLFIYSDAPKGQADEAAVDAVRQYIRTVKGFAEVTVVERTENWGLARSVIDGVTAQVERYGRVIVVEDDLVVAPHFLQFMNDALEVYADEPKVGHIHACDFTQNPALPESFLIKWTGSWGWATWARAWKLFNPDGQALLQTLRSRQLTHTFNFDDSYNYTRMLEHQVLGKNNSWAIRWNASLFLNDVLSLNAGRSLVVNTGFDGSGTHCGDADLYQTALYPDRLEVQKITPVQESKTGRDALAYYYRRTNSFRAKVLRRINKLLRR